MAILDVIEFLDDRGEIIVKKMPERGSGAFRLGSQMVVQRPPTQLTQRHQARREHRKLDPFAAENLSQTRTASSNSSSGPCPHRATRPGHNH